MPDPRPAQQIGELLTQSGVPSNHSLDIAQRLLTLSDSSQTKVDSGTREITSSQARTSSFLNRFKAKEQKAIDGNDGRAGKDGLPGYGGTGIDGKDGQDGQAGQDGQVDISGLTEIVSGILEGLLPGLLDRILNCVWFRKKAATCLNDGGGGGTTSLPCKPPIKGDIECCAGNGVASAKSVCSQLDQISKELLKIKERLDECCGGGDLVRWVCINNTCVQRIVANNTIGSATEAQCSAGCGGNRPPKMWFWCDKTTDPRNPTCRSSNTPDANVGPLYLDQIECQKACLPIQQITRGGPGTELKKLLAAMGYEATENCPCNARAREMDENGVQWVRDNTETVIDWLEEQAKERKSWVFTRAGAAALIEVACLMAGSEEQIPPGGT